MGINDLRIRLESLPGELEIARRFEYEAAIALALAEKDLGLAEARFLLANPPPAKNPDTGKATNADYRERCNLVAMDADQQLRQLKQQTLEAEALVASRKRAVSMLQDRFSSLRNLVRLAASERVLAASGSRGESISAIIDLAIDRALRDDEEDGVPF